MSVREYIGARYVPVFAEPAEWDATRTYEPLTVVMYQGNSYTSRQAVPANIPINNTTYWAQTGNYNAQVEQYRQEVENFDGRIEELEDTVSPYTSSNTIQSAISTAITNEASARTSAISTAITNEASARTSADNQLSNRITALETKPIMVVIGDSWSYHQDGSAVTPMWDDIVSVYNGCTVRNYSRGAVGYMRDKANCYYDQITAAANELDPSNVKYVYIVGGLNDVYRSDVQYSSFVSAVNQTFVHASTEFPNSMIIVAGIQRYQNGNVANNTTPLNFFKIELFTTIIAEECTVHNNCKFISLQNYGIIGNGIYQTNGHPTAKGHRNLAMKIMGGDYYAGESMNIYGAGLPILHMSDDTVYTAGDIVANVVHKGGNLYGCAFTFAGVDGTKLDGNAYIDFKGAPAPTKWPMMLGIQTGKIVTIDATDTYSLGSTKYGNASYLSTFHIPHTRADIAQNSALYIGYDFMM